MSPLFFRPRVQEVDPIEAKRRHDEKSALLVDVRERFEWRQGHIPGARHIPLGELPTTASELLQAPDVIFVCHSGYRSASATAALKRAGHPSAGSLAGGMVAWTRQGLPVQR